MEKCRMPLDVYDLKPDAMIAYLRYNGYHFNKKMCDWAVGRMRKVNKASGKEEPIEPISKDKVEEMMQTNGLTLENLVGYDHVYVANMCKADLWGKSIKDEASLAQYVKDTIDDVDQKDGFVFNRFYADCCHNGMPIPWEDLL